MRARVLTSPDGKQAVGFAQTGALCAECVEGVYVMSPDGSNRRRLDTSAASNLIANGTTIAWSTDSRHVYYPFRDPDGTSSIWQAPLNGDKERMIIHFKDPARQIFRPVIAADSKNLYFPLGDRQSDIWTMQLKKQ